MLRRPGDRLLSFYRYICRTKEHPLNNIINRANMSFGEFLEFVDGNPQLKCQSDNVQMRIISGMTEVEQLGNEKIVFRAAIENLLSGEVMFGLTENLNGFQAYLKHINLIREISPSRLNAADTPTNARDVVGQLTAEQSDIFENYVAWDQLVYDICVKLDRDRQKTLSKI